MKITFFETKPEDQTILQSLLPDLDLNFTPDILSKETTTQAVDSEVISVFVGSKVDRPVIDALPKLKAILTRSTGFDHIDSEYARQKGIVVCNVAGYGATCVAEFTFGLILSLSRKIVQANRKLRETDEFSFEHLQGFDLHGKILGIIGTGRIGQNVARLAVAFGMKILAFDVHPNDELAKFCQYVSLDSLLQQSDVITVHVPYGPTTHHLLNQDKLKLIKPGTVMVNTSRGEIIETEALMEALNDGRLAGAGLDVLEGEHELKEELQLLADPISSVADFKKLYEGHHLIHLPQVVVTPHMAFYSKEAIAEILQTTAENLKKFLTGKPQNVV